MNPALNRKSYPEFNKQVILTNVQLLEQDDKINLQIKYLDTAYTPTIN